MTEQKNFILALVLSIGIFVGWDYFFGTKNVPNQADKTQTVLTDIAEKETITASAEPLILDREAAISDKRAFIKSDKIKGSINLKGGCLDDITLLEYKTSVKENADYVDLLSPKNTKEAYFVDFDILCPDQTELPKKDAMWEIQGNDTLTTKTPVTIYWVNQQGVRFERTFTLDDNYLITVANKVVNNSADNICIQQKAFIQRNKPKTEGFFILHEGALGFLDNHLVERDYDKLTDNKKEDIASKGGWIGFTDKYWLVAIVPNQQANSTFSFTGKEGSEFSAATKIEQKSIHPGEAVEQSINIFVGPKKLALLDGYEESLKVKNFDLAIDFGWFYFLTKPLFQFLDIVNSFVGNFGIAILIMTLLSKLLLFPLANKSYRSMGRMKTLTPKMDQLKKRYKDDPVKLQKEMMNLYKTEKVNPLSGCLPMLIQAPIFFCLYKVLFVSIEMRHAPFFGWIHDLSSQDPTTIFNLFGLLPFTPPSFLMIGIWPILMGVTMLWQQKLNPQPMDEAQAKMMMLMPIFFTYLLSSFPAGLVIYWTFSNILSIIQQKAIMEISKKKA
jgi:YidC/Oxa1 family membrane protein insertase